MEKKKNKEDKLKEYINEEDRRTVIYTHYEYTMQDYEAGLTLESLKATLKHYEDEELYLPCAGISKAIKEIEKYSCK